VAMKPAQGHLRKRHLLRNTLIISGAVLLMLLAAAYLAGCFFFQSHFGINTTVNGRNLSFLGTSEADERLALNTGSYELLIVGREGLQLVVDAAEINLQYVATGQPEALIKDQNPWLWFTRIIPQPQQIVVPTYTFDSALLSSHLAEQKLFDKAKMRPPTDARAVFEDGKYVIKEADLGTTLDKKKSTKAIADCISSGQESCDLDAAKCYVAPSLTESDDDLVKQINEFNKYAPFEITYTFGDQTEVLDANTAIKWFKAGSNGKKTLDISAVDAWVADFADRHDTVGATRDFTTAAGAHIQVSGGSYGWSINEVAERNAIIEAIANQSSETREPVYLQRADNHALPDFSNTYVEVDQSTQHMWYFVAGKLVLESDVVTGFPNAKRATPNGVFYIRSKASPAKLRGPRLPNGEYEWESTVQYWMQVTAGGVGLHDAYWQSSFGLARWQAGFGSHGCINMPFAKAQELYNTLKIGTPVIIHA